MLRSCILICNTILHYLMLCYVVVHSVPLCYVIVCFSAADPLELKLPAVELLTGKGVGETTPRRGSP